MLPNRFLFILLPSLITVSGLQMLRIFLPGVFFAEGSFAFDDVGIYVFGIFLLGFLAPVFIRFLGAGTVMIAGLVVAFLRILVQFFDDSSATALAAAGVFSYIIFLTGFIAYLKELSEDLRLFAVGIALGLAIDTAIKGYYFTADLFMIEGLLPVVFVFLISALTGYFLFRLPGTPRGQKPMDTAYISAPVYGWLAVGPYLFLEILVFRNIGRMQVLGEMNYGPAFFLVQLGGMLLLVVYYFLYRLPPFYQALVRIMLTAAMAAVLQTFLFRLTPETAGGYVFASLLGQLLAGILFFRIISAKGLSEKSAAKAKTGGLMPGIGDAVFFAAGMVIFAFLVFVYYSTYGYFPVVFIFGGILLGFFAIIATLRDDAELRSPAPVLTALILSAALLLFPLFRYITASPETGEMPDPEKQQLTVMVYDLETRAGTDAKYYLEKQARFIEESGADLIALQNVNRGWTIHAGVDSLLWLSQRLNMPIYYAPFAGDLKGQAFLSRYPVEEFVHYPFKDIAPLEAEGIIGVHIAMGQQRLRIIAARLSDIAGRPSANPEVVENIRTVQSDMMIELWDRAPYSIVMGTFYSGPDDSVVQRFLEEGFSVADSGFAGQPEDPYVLFSEGLQIQTTERLESPVSDLQPLKATVQW